MKKLIVDLDDTISFNIAGDYSTASLNRSIIDRLKQYHADGFSIVINTARNMRTYEGNTGKITAHTLPIIIEWLNEHNIPYDEIYIGKPWCGTEGFYIDDKAIRPAEFINYSYEEIMGIIKRDTLEPDS